MTLPNRFFGLVEMDAATATTDFSTIVNGAIQHFAAHSRVDATVTVEIEARTRDGFEARLQRIIKECWRRSKFDPPCRLNFDPGLGADIG
ncbi:hypothetical protein [Roseateles flavus]|uniref:Uncharacterized protein n=1 Tax=Roseateles flavus TaxID=3149041 RepID=A0ABV0GL56_9BURK